jgi:hypothetical protein
MLWAKYIRCQTLSCAYLYIVGKRTCLVVFNTTFNNISVISLLSVLLVEETGGPGENHLPVASHIDTGRTGNQTFYVKSTGTQSFNKSEAS